MKNFDLSPLFQKFQNLHAWTTFVNHRILLAHPDSRTQNEEAMNDLIKEILYEQRR